MNMLLTFVVFSFLPHNVYEKFRIVILRQKLPNSEYQIPRETTYQLHKTSLRVYDR